MASIVSIQANYLQFKNNMYSLGFVSVICIGITAYLGIIINNKVNFLLEENASNRKLIVKKLAELEEKIISKTQNNIVSTQTIEENNEVYQDKINNDKIDVEYLTEYDNIPAINNYNVTRDKYTFW